MSATAVSATLPRIVEADPAQVWFGRRGYVLRTEAEMLATELPSQATLGLSSYDFGEIPRLTSKKLLGGVV
jgi:hypothetical protein